MTYQNNYTPRWIDVYTRVCIQTHTQTHTLIIMFIILATTLLLNIPFMFARYKHTHTQTQAYTRTHKYIIRIVPVSWRSRLCTQCDAHNWIEHRYRANLTTAREVSLSELWRWRPISVIGYTSNTLHIRRSNRTSIFICNRGYPGNVWSVGETYDDGAMRFIVVYFIVIETGRELQVVIRFLHLLVSWASMENSLKLIMERLTQKMHLEHFLDRVVCANENHRSTGDHLTSMLRIFNANQMCWSHTLPAMILLLTCKVGFFNESTWILVKYFASPF